MTVQECYEKMNEDYMEMYGRIGSEALIKKFLLRFLEDKSITTLKEGLEEKDGEKAFRAAHTLKGVCLNFAFNQLFKLSSDLTESLRGHDVTGTEEQFAAVQKKYDEMVEIIKQLDENK